VRPDDLKQRNFDNEFVYSASRSSGAGGQNINKVNTKVELRFSITSSMLLSEEEKKLLFIRLPNKINLEGELRLVSQSERTQLLNKRVVTEKFYITVSKALSIPSKRKATRPTISSVRKRIEEKRILGTKKKLRKRSGDLSGD
jgi:ribosome-associated protein